MIFRPFFRAGIASDLGVKDEKARLEFGDSIADGLAVRVPDPAALAVICGGADRIVEVSEPELVEAATIYFSDTHTLAEGAGAAPLAALMKERARMQGRRVGLIMTGQNIDRAAMCEVLAGRVPGRSGGVAPYLSV